MKSDKINLQKQMIKNNLDLSLNNVGDMALKRCARNIIEGLEFREGDKILEIGCGNGYILSLLNRLNMDLEIIGIDIDKRALDDAKKFISNKKIKLIQANAEKLPFKSNSFDKIVMSSVIEHVGNDELVLNEANRVLKKEGIITLTTCNIDYPFLWDPINWVLQHFLHTHLRTGFWAGIWNQHDRIYKKEEVEKLMKKAGFKIKNSRLLTFWCLPFNHYIVNFIAKLFYHDKLPKSLYSSMNKFKNDKQILWVTIFYWVVNTIDSLNDLLPTNIGVSIFVKAIK